MRVLKDMVSVTRFLSEYSFILMMQCEWINWVKSHLTTETTVRVRTAMMNKMLDGLASLFRLAAFFLGAYIFIIIMLLDMEPTTIF